MPPMQPMQSGMVPQPGMFTPHVAPFGAPAGSPGAAAGMMPGAMDDPLTRLLPPQAPHHQENHPQMRLSPHPNQMRGLQVLLMC